MARAVAADYRIASRRNQSRILVVDDDSVVRVLLREMLAEAGHEVVEARSGSEAEHHFRQGTWDLVLLDRRLPDCDGLVLLRQIRESIDCPVIVLTVLGDERDRILGLDLGAHDYITKPFNAVEVGMRIRNLLQSRDAPILPSHARQIDFGPFSLVQTTRRLHFRNVTHQLAPTEARLLAVFLTHAGVVLDRNLLTRTILQREWSHNDRSVDVLVARLRKRIERDPKTPQWIITVHGAGYLFSGDSDLPTG